MSSKISGSCYCENIHFELTGKPKMVVNCHCDDCKKRNGTAFSTYIAVAENELQLSKGENSLKQYEADNVGIKYFCSDCGSPIYNKNFRLPGLSLIFFGALRNPADFNPQVNVFCSTKAAWVDNINAIPSFQGSIER
ncbi:MAG: GFA family protein [Gammaproteobacteria bacterium]|nr:GFA family protein [Gammaproteobacteria bacterium]